MKPEELKKVDAEQLKQLMASLSKTAQPSLKQDLLDAIQKADFNKASEYFSDVVKTGFDGFEAEFDLSIIRPAIHDVLGVDKIDELLEQELWDDPDVQTALAKTIWEAILKSGQNFIEFLY